MSKYDVAMSISAFFLFLGPLGIMWQGFLWKKKCDFTTTLYLAVLVDLLLVYIINRLVHGC